jgi:predicted nucleic acid-binding protein
MDVVLDANAYLQVLYGHGRSFLQTNQFTELLTYLRRTGSRLVIPELTYNEVVARYQDRLIELANGARKAWNKLQQVGMEHRIDFIEPNIQREVAALGDLLRRPGPGVASVIHTDYSGVDVREVARRGIGRVRPANDAGEELRDVILWMVVLTYARQTKNSMAFVSGDKTFQDSDGALDPLLQKDVEGAQVAVVFYPSVGDFVKGNALESQSVAEEALAAYVGAKELLGIATEQLLGAELRIGTIVGAEVSRLELVEAKKYRVAADSYYIEARYTIEATIRVSHPSLIYTIGSLSPVRYSTVTEGAVAGLAGLQYQFLGASGEGYNEVTIPGGIPKTSESAYRGNFGIRLSLRIVADNRESVEVDELGQLTELVPVTGGGS